MRFLEQLFSPPRSLSCSLIAHIRFVDSLFVRRTNKVVGSSTIRRTRGETIVLRSETALPSCATIGVDEELASYSWSLVSANESFAGAADVSTDVGRDPRTLAIPPYTLGYSGSFYHFQLRTAFGSDLTGAANATGEHWDLEAV